MSIIIPRNYTFDDFNSFQSIPYAHYTGAFVLLLEENPHGRGALSRVTPRRCSTTPYRFRYCFTRDVCFAEYLVDWLHSPLPANPVGMVLLPTLILRRALPP